MVQNESFVLTAILEFWCFFVFIEVALGVDNGVCLFEMVGTFFADSIGVMGESSDAGIDGTSLSFGDKLENSLIFVHVNNKIKYPSFGFIVLHKLI